MDQVNNSSGLGFTRFVIILQVQVEFLRLSGFQLKKYFKLSIFDPILLGVLSLKKFSRVWVSTISNILSLGFWGFGFGFWVYHKYLQTQP